MKADDLNGYIIAITDRFSTAKSITEATHLLSTQEVKDAIVCLNPGADISNEKVFELMQSAGFNFISPSGTIGIGFKWILIEK